MIIINFYTNYLYPVVVESVGIGCISAEGKTLRLIGNFPVQPGDVVFTDGRIAYGHAPVRSQVDLPSGQKGIPTIGHSSYNTAYNPTTGEKIQKITSQTYPQFKNHTINWLYTTPSNIYTYTRDTENPSIQRFDSDDSAFYLDMHVTDNSVWTAEFTNTHYEFQGKIPKSQYKGWADPTFFCANCYLSESNGYDPATNPEFDFNWFDSDYPKVGDGGRVYSNVGIRIRKNGQQVQLIKLSDFQYALQKLIDIYVSNDYLDPEIKKRYSWKGYVPHDGDRIYTNVDIFIAYLLTQCLHFHFTDDNGNWEAIIFSMCEGCCSPHTIDDETNEETGELEDVHSYYNFPVPVCYFVARVNSQGEVHQLQHHFVVKKWTNNQVDKSTWTNARAHSVPTCNDKSTPKFWINWADLAYETDLRFIYQMTYNNMSFDLSTSFMNPRMFRYLVITNYNAGSEPGGAVNSFISIDLRTGEEYVMPFAPTHFGFISGNNMFAYGIMHDTSLKFTYITNDGNAYLGKLTGYHYGKRYFVSLGFHQFYVFDEEGKKLDENIPFSYNMNVNCLRDIRKLKHPKNINDLVAYVTSRNNNNNNNS